VNKLSEAEFAELLLGLHMKEFNDLIPSDHVTRDSKLYPPEIDDLYRLYQYVIDNSVLSILEFGSGWSTFALHLGLLHNKEKYCEHYDGSGRFTNLFKLVSVDTSEYFFHKAISRINPPSTLTDTIKFHLARPTIELFNGFPLAFWSPPPRWEFDLVYVDAPEPEQLVSQSFQFPLTTKNDFPISGDLLRYEPYIFPGTSVIFDGRTSNSRFVGEHLYRNWEKYFSLDKDISCFYLEESPLGRVHARHLKFRLSNCAGDKLNVIQ